MVVTRKLRDAIFAVACMLPAALIVGLCLFIPVLQTAGISFLDLSLTHRSAAHFNNFKNYLTVIHNGSLFNSLGVTFVFVFWTTLVLFVLGMALALILSRSRRGGRLFRSLVLMPWVIPTVISALLWSWIFQPQYGVLNYLVKVCGISQQGFGWLADPKLALPSIAVAAVWKQLPFMFLMLLAGMQGISEDLREAALIDGAGPVQSFFAVTLPSLRNVISTTLLVTVITNFKQFPLFQIMTNGGPMDRTANLAILSYREAFGNLDFGTGAAVSTVWLVVLLIFSLVYRKIVSVVERE